MAIRHSIAADSSFTPRGKEAWDADHVLESLSPETFGGIGNGVANDSAAILAVSVAAVAQGKYVDFGGKTWLIGTQIALTSAHASLKWVLQGATLKKGFSGNLITVTGTPSFSIDGVGVIDGQHGTFTGKGIVFTGAGSTNPYFAAGILFTSFTDTHIEFGADAGQYAKVDSNFRAATSPAQSDARIIHCTGTDTGAMQRDINGSMNGYIDLDGAQATHISSALVTRVEINSTCVVTVVRGVSWSNGGSAMTIDGSGTIIGGCRFAGDVTIQSGSSGAWGVNFQTQGTFTDNSVAGDWAIWHKAPSAAQYLIGKNTMILNTTAQRIQTSRSVSIGDANSTFAAGDAPFQMWLSTLTANRTATLSNTGKVDGDRFYAMRVGAGDFSLVLERSGGFDLMTLLKGMWGAAQFDGSEFTPLMSGTLTGGVKAQNSTTAVGNVGGGEDDLISITMPLAQIGTIASTAYVKSLGVRIKAWGTTANNSNPKTVKLLFGGSTIITTALTVSQVGVWEIEAEIMSTGTNTQTYVSRLIQGGATTLLDVESGTLSVTDGSTIIVKATGTVTDGGGGINNNDIVQSGMTIIYIG